MRNILIVYLLCFAAVVMYWYMFFSCFTNHAKYLDVLTIGEFGPSDRPKLFIQNYHWFVAIGSLLPLLMLISLLLVLKKRLRWNDLDASVGVVHITFYVLALLLTAIGMILMIPMAMIS